MTATKHRECYGKLLPVAERSSHSQCREGRVFRVSVEKIGIGTQRQEVEFSPEAWEECIACPEFRPCYDLSMARLAVHLSLAFG